jgi:CheY-like chemotaxis protein
VDKLSGTLILLIEDDATVLDATQQLIETWGCRVIAAQSMEQALLTVAALGEPLGLIIADYRLPGQANGVEAITRVQLAVGTAVPAIIITGDVETDEIRDISDLGYRLLYKPIRPAKLRALVNHMVQQRGSFVPDMPQARSA